MRRQLVEYDQPVGMGGVQYPNLGEGGGGNEFRRKDHYIFLQSVLLSPYNLGNEAACFFSFLFFLFGMRINVFM